MPIYKRCLDDDLLLLPCSLERQLNCKIYNNRVRVLFVKVYYGWSANIGKFDLVRMDVNRANGSISSLKKNFLHNKLLFGNFWHSCRYTFHCLNLFYFFFYLPFLSRKSSIFMLPPNFESTMENCGKAIKKDTLRQKQSIFFSVHVRWFQDPKLTGTINFLIISFWINLKFKCDCLGGYSFFH